MAPFGKAGGSKDRGIFASNRHFHMRAQRQEKHFFEISVFAAGLSEVI